MAYSILEYSHVPSPLILTELLPLFSSSLCGVTPSGLAELKSQILPQVNSPRPLTSRTRSNPLIADSPHVKYFSFLSFVNLSLYSCVCIYMCVFNVCLSYSSMNVGQKTQCTLFPGHSVYRKTMHITLKLPGCLWIILKLTWQWKMVSNLSR